MKWWRVGANGLLHRELTLLTKCLISREKQCQKSYVGTSWLWFHANQNDSIIKQMSIPIFGVEIMVSYLLVGGLSLKHFLFFHMLGIIIPTDFHIFQDCQNHQPVSLFWLVKTLLFPIVSSGPGPGPVNSLPCRVSEDCRLRRSGSLRATWLEAVDAIVGISSMIMIIMIIQCGLFHIPSGND